MLAEPISSAKYDLEQTQTEQLFVEHGDFLMRVLKKDLPEQDALDLFQGLYLGILRRGIPKNVNNVRAYLYRAAVNDIIDYKRKILNRERNIEKYSHHFKPYTSVDDPAEKLSQFSAVMDVFEKIGNYLRPAIKQVFVQKYQYNLDRDEIAEKLNLKKATVDRYLSVGTKKIQELQAQFFGETDE